MSGRRLRAAGPAGMTENPVNTTDSMPTSLGLTLPILCGAAQGGAERAERRLAVGLDQTAFPSRTRCTKRDRKASLETGAPRSAGRLPA
jgi:hypothetical protein